MRPITSRTLVAVATMEAVLILYVVSFFVTMNSDNSVGGPPPGSGIAATSPRPVSATPGAEPAAPAPSPTPHSTSSADPLVAAALRVKTLADLLDGDRVLYEGQVRFFRGWDERPQLAWVADTATTGDRVQVQTGKLTPVELVAR